MPFYIEKVYILKYFHNGTQKSTPYFSMAVISMYDFAMEKILYDVRYYRQYCNGHSYISSFHSCVQHVKWVTILFPGIILYPQSGVCYALLPLLYPWNLSLCYLKNHALFFPFDAFLSERLSNKCFWQDSL